MLPWRLISVLTRPTALLTGGHFLGRRIGGDEAEPPPTWSGICQWGFALSVRSSGATSSSGVTAMTSGTMTRHGAAQTC